MQDGDQFVLLVEAMRKAQLAYSFKRRPDYAKKKKEKEKLVDEYIFSLKEKG
mgnify:FL=1|tara:strand:- start:141 stop:296 length:156 start_codon:yes stop_codon:yes gene_type:complete